MALVNVVILFLEKLCRFFSTFSNFFLWLSRLGPPNGPLSPLQQYLMHWFCCFQSEYRKWLIHARADLFIRAGVDGGRPEKIIEPLLSENAVENKWQAEFRILHSYSRR